MAHARVRAVLLVALAFLLFVPVAHAQTQNAGVAGVVKDSSGTPVAGVTVEVASPAMIEKTRTVTTDGQGQYKINDLVIGTYSITFRAPGFVSERHENLELGPAFTASISPMLKAGNPNETVTVTANASSVDTRGNTQTAIVSAETQSKLASGTQDAQSVAKLASGVQGATDVGGSAGSYVAQGNSLTIRGKAGVKRLFDGLRVENMEGNGSTSYMVTSTIVATSVVETGGGNAESMAAGGTINSVPKSGSNSTKWGLQGLYTREAWQADNLDQGLKDRGLTIGGVNKVGAIWDSSFTIGGPIKKDKLWYILSWRRWGNRNFAGAGGNWNNNQAGLTYSTSNAALGATPLVYVPGVRGDQFEEYRSQPLRLTWQASPKNKFNFLVDYPDSGCTCRNLPGTSAPEAVSYWWFGEYPNFWTWDPANHNLGYGLFQTTWSSPRTSKLLLEAGWSWMLGSWPEPFQNGVTSNSISISDQNNSNFRYGSMSTYSGPSGHPNHQSDRMAERFSVAYVTGSHAMKFGFQDEQGFRGAYVYNTSLGYGVNNGAPVQFRVASDFSSTTGTSTTAPPNQITEFTTPYETFSRIKHDMGLYAQDQWTIKRLTVNYGVRFSYFNAYAPEADLAASFFRGAVKFAEKDCIPCWKDLDPRVGVAYDLFGNGRTAIKGSVGRYVNVQVVSIANAANPIATSVTSTTRTWTDTNGNRYPDCNLLDTAAQGPAVAGHISADACGSISDGNFGSTTNPKATLWTDGVVNGSFVRGYIWDFSAEINHQITRAMSIGGGYYRNIGGNFTTTRNQAYGNSIVAGATTGVLNDFAPFCVVGPVDPRLGAASGQTYCGLSSLNRAAATAISINRIQQSSEFGEQTTHNDFFGAQFQGRFARDIRGGASVDIGRTVSDSCFVTNTPSDTIFVTSSANAVSSYCHSVTPWTKNLQLKANASVPLMYGFTVAPTIQNLPGAAITALWTAPNAQIVAFAPNAAVTPITGSTQVNLGRNIGESCAATGACTGTFAIPLLQPGSTYEPRRTQVDLRFSKTLKLTSKIRSQWNFDIYNLTNNNAVTTLNTGYASTAAQSAGGSASTAGGTWLKPTKVLDARLLQIGGRIDF